MRKNGQSTDTLGSKILASLLRLGVLGSLISLSSLFSAYHLVFDLLSNFRVQFIVLIALPLGLALLSKRYLMSAVLAACLAVHAATVITSLSGQKGIAPNGTPALRVMTSNLWASNNAYQNHIQYVLNVDPDIIVFQEFTHAWQTELSASLTAYRYKVEAPENSPFGIALYSKLPLKDSGVLNFPPNFSANVKATVELESGALTVLGTHPPPPASQALYSVRNEVLAHLADTASESEVPIAIVGDLNATPWSAHFRALIKDGHLVDSRRGFGVLPSWPAKTYPLQIPIDHILVSADIGVSRVEVSAGLTSDHKSLWADLYFAD